MATVALLVHPDHAEARVVADRAAAWLAAEGHRAHDLEPPGHQLDAGLIDLAGADLAVSLGGDGTFLRLVSMAWAAGVPVLGVNFGKLGYLLELEPADLVPTLARALAGELEIEHRVALSITVSPPPSGGEPDRSGSDGPADPTGEERSWFALNEVVLEKTVFGHTVRLATAIDGEPFLAYSADGLLVATPTGSTAYNLSAGGPVLAPTLRAMVVTPVAPHLSLDRSLVLHPDQVVTVEVEHDRPAALVVDGNDAGRVQPGGVVTCRVAQRPVRLVTIGRHRFGALLGNRTARAPGD